MNSAALLWQRRRSLKSLFWFPSVIRTSTVRLQNRCPRETRLSLGLLAAVFRPCCQVQLPHGSEKALCSFLGEPLNKVHALHLCFQLQAHGSYAGWSSSSHLGREGSSHIAGPVDWRIGSCLAPTESMETSQ